MRRCKTKAPEPIGTLACRLPVGHIGPCSFKGGFGKGDERLIVDAAWISPSMKRNHRRHEHAINRIRKLIV